MADSVSPSPSQGPLLPVRDQESMTAAVVVPAPVPASNEASKEGILDDVKHLGTVAFMVVSTATVVVGLKSLTVAGQVMARCAAALGGSVSFATYLLWLIDVDIIKN